MAVVGEASIVIKPVTSGFASGLKKGLASGSKEIESSGTRMGNEFSKNFNRGMQRRQLFGPQWFRAADRAAKRLTSLVRVGRVLGPALAFLAGSVAALGAGFFMLASAVGAASPALIVLPASLLAIAQAAIVLKAAFSGVSSAISAGLNAGGGGGASGQAEAVKNALEQVADARERLARTYEDAAERIAEANDKIVDAENDYIDAQADSVKAANALSKAREEATEDLQQLRFETEDAAISEGKARLEFEKSRESLQRVQDLPPNSRARREAELAFAEADLNLRRAIDTNADLKKAESTATAAGVEGSDKVLSAKEELADARQREADAANAVAEAIADAAKVERDALRSIADAQTALARALDDVDAAKKSGAGGSNAYADALAKLSPPAQDFVRYMVGTFIPTLKEIRDVAAANLFPKLTTALETLRTKLFTQQFKDNIAGTASVLGDVAINLANVVTKGENVDRLDRIWETNDGLIRNFGDATGNLYEIFLILLDAARPLITEFGNWTREVTEAWKQTLTAKEKTGELGTAFTTAGDLAKDIIDIIKNVAGALFDMGKAALGPGSGGQMLIDAMKEGSEKFKDFTGSTEGQNKLDQYFKDAAVNVLAVSSLIGEILKQIALVGDNKGVGVLAGKLETAVTILGKLGDKLTEPKLAESIGDVAIVFAELLVALTDSGGIQAFFDTLGTLLTPIKDFFESDVGQKILETVGPVLATLSAVGLVASTAQFFFSAAIGTVGKLYGLAITLTNVLFGTQMSNELTLNTFKTGLLNVFAAIQLGLESAFAAYRAAREAGHNVFRAAAEAIYHGIRTTFELIFHTLRTSQLGIFVALRTAGEFIFNTLRTAAEVAFSLLRMTGLNKFLGARMLGESAYQTAVKLGFISATGGMTIMNGLATVFRTIMLTNPLFLIPGIIIAVGAAFVILYNKFKPFKDLVDKVVEGFKKVGGFLGGLFGGGGGGGGGGGATAMAEGGVVKPSRYGTLAVIGEAGRSERVEPLDPNGLSNRDKAMINMMSGGGGGGPTINVYPSEGMDERQLAAVVSRQLAFQMRKGSM
jgi:hypothetical protein